VKLLLDKNADVNAQGGEYGNALRRLQKEYGLLPETYFGARKQAIDGTRALVPM
jgi:hypothetical protein